MKIISVNISSFGKLTNWKHDFSNGVNLLKEDNGFGKTTLCAFIRAMLYGIGYNYTKVGDERINDVKRYMPWGSNGLFGGSMVVEHNGENYRIERFFGSKATQEQLSVIRLSTGKSVPITTSVGEYFLGLTADSFDRSAYIPQESVEMSSTENFDQKLANLVESGQVDYDKVVESIRNYKKRFKYERGLGGSLYELDRQEMALTQQQSTIVANRKRDEQIALRLSQIDKEEQQLLQRQQMLQQQVEQAQIAIAQSAPSAEQLQTKQRIAELEQRVYSVPKQLVEDSQQCQQLLGEIDRQKAIKKKPNVLLIVGVLLALLGVGLAFVNLVVGIVVSVIGLVVTVVSLSKGKAKNKPTVAEELTKQYLQIAQKYVNTYQKDIATIQQELWNIASEYSKDVEVLSALKATVRQTQPAPAVDTGKLASLQQTAQQVAVQLRELSAEKGRLTAERGHLNLDLAPISDQLMNIEQQRQKDLFAFQTAQTVMDLLAQAKENLSTSYIPKLCNRCTQLVSRVLAVPTEVQVDASFTVKLLQNGSAKNLAFFSRGIRELTLLCFRISLSELLFDGQIPFLLVDDAFVNFDEDNFVRATQLLKDIATNGQVIYFTCHNRKGRL